MARSNGSKSVVVAPSLVQIQTVKVDSNGYGAALAAIGVKVAAFNKATKAQHIVVEHAVMPMNTKGMQASLALVAVLARSHGASMIRVGVHGGQVAICGPKAAVQATIDAIMPMSGQLRTLADNTYRASEHGARVGFINGFLCGAPAGLQLARGLVATIAYAAGYLFDFPTPGTGSAYLIGQQSAQALATAPAKAPAKARAKTPAKAPAKVEHTEEAIDILVQATTEQVA